MAVNATLIATDLSGIFTDLADTGASESATIYGPKGVTERGTVTLIRANTLRDTELRDSGWADQYALSLYMIASDDPGVQVDDRINISDGDYRVLHIHTGPLTIYKRLDIGGLWGDET